jgi:ubiquinone/menaquinone biosynthesis C-methylase UbiE
MTYSTASNQPAWYPDELAHAGPEHLDAEYVAGYDRKAGVDPTEELHKLQRLGLRANSTLIDLGAGTGAFALAAAPHSGRVVAVDISPAMLAVLQQRAQNLGVNNVECVHAGFLTYEHSGAPADFVYVRHALHQLPDFWKAVALQRIAAYLRPRGVLRIRDLFLSCALGEVDTVVEAWLANAPADASHGWPRAELETHLRDEHSTFTWLFEPMLAQAGFTITEASYTPSQTHASYTCVRGNTSRR